MARKRSKETITQKYNKYAIGLEYFGESASQKKRASRKELREIIKQYRHVRQLQREMGVTDLPNIAQIYKYALEQPLLPKSEELEPLPYADKPLNMQEFDYPIIEELLTVLNDIVLDSDERFNYINAGSSNPHLAITTLCARITESIAQIIDNPSIKEKFADYLAKSEVFDQLKTYRYYHYSDIINSLENMSDTTIALINDFDTFQGEQPPFIAPTDINFNV